MQPHLCCCGSVCSGGKRGVDERGVDTLRLFGDAIEYVQPPLCSEDDVFACGEARGSECVQLLGTETEQHLELHVVGSELRIMLGA